MAWTGRATVFPSPMSLGATFNGSLILEIGEAVAKEVHYILAVLAYSVHVCRIEIGCSVHLCVIHSLM